VVFFGVGSLAVSAFLSVVIALPLRYSAAVMSLLHGVLHGAIGLATVAIGVRSAYGAGRSLCG